jgi:hypothetical protein
MKWEISEEILEKIRVWHKEQDDIVLKRQREDKDAHGFQQALNEHDIPYYGAIGGELTYCFTPTSLGDILIVKHSGTKAELDVTPYHEW